MQFYLLDHGSYSAPAVELVYGLARGYWGQGLVAEAAQALTRYGFETLKLQRITSVAYRESVRSANVMRPVGITVGSHPASADEVLGILHHPHQSAEAEHGETIT